ncbi:MAG: glycosyltransferase [Subtercola sp.]|nr:glycosyltransferase [Subtercola sp.]
MNPEFETAQRAVGRPPRVALPGNRWDLLDGVKPLVPPRVTVIIPYYRQQAELDRTLAALGRQTHPPDRLEIIVVDDGSPMLPTVPSHVSLLTQPDLGFRVAAARNLGARHATGDVLCFLDADTSPEPDYVERLTRLPSLAPDVVTVGARRHADLSMYAPTDPIEHVGPASQLPTPSWLDDEYARTGNLLRADDRSYRFVIGAVACCSRELFATLGGFDETFTSYGGEDWEWAHRAWSQGALFAHVPDAVAWHDGPEWSARQASRAELVRVKNAETLRLMRSIAVSNGRPAALRTGAPRVVARVLSAPSLAALVVCVDELLGSLDDVVVVLPRHEQCLFDDVAGGLATAFRADDRVLLPEKAGPVIHTAGVVIDVPAPVRCLSELAGALQELTADDLGSVTLTDAAGDLLLVVTSQRATRREARWGVTLFAHNTRSVANIKRLTAEPDLEAYFGGWGETLC